MSIPAAHNTFLHNARSAAQALTQQIGPLTSIDALWAGAPNYDALITQAEIDSVTSMLESGYTIAEITDALYALAVIKGVILDHLPALSRLADLP